MLGFSLFLSPSPFYSILPLSRFLCFLFSRHTFLSPLLSFNLFRFLPIFSFPSFLFFHDSSVSHLLFSPLALFHHFLNPLPLYLFFPPLTSPSFSHPSTLPYSSLPFPPKLSYLLLSSSSHSPLYFFPSLYSPLLSLTLPLSFSNSHTLFPLPSLTLPPFPPFSSLTRFTLFSPLLSLVLSLLFLSLSSFLTLSKRIN